MKYNFSKRLNKYRITRWYLYKYLRDWENPNKNYFYYATKEEIKTLTYLINFIKGKFNELRLSPEQYQFLKDIGDSKKLHYGRYEYTF